MSAPKLIRLFESCGNTQNVYDNVKPVFCFITDMTQAEFSYYQSDHNLREEGTDRLFTDFPLKNISNYIKNIAVAGSSFNDFSVNGAIDKANSNNIYLAKDEPFNQITGTAYYYTATDDAFSDIIASYSRSGTSGSGDGDGTYRILTSYSSPYYYTDIYIPLYCNITDLTNAIYRATLHILYRCTAIGQQEGYSINIVGSSTSNMYNAYKSLLDLPPYEPITDPYNGAGNSSVGGGDGTFDGSSDPVPVPSLPSIGATDTGFISLFVPSASQIRQVASYLWSNFFDLATFKKLFEDPMDCILGLSVVPVSVPTSGSAQITVGNIELSGISLPLASQQYVEIDCGTVDFTRRYFGSYLDFEPYTKMSLFVPYSGVHAVSADDIIGKVVGLKYHIDILTGSLVAFLTCGNSVLYEFNGACASNIPVNSMNYASTIENAIRIAVNIGTTVATAGAAAPLTGENVAARTAAKEFGTGVAVAGSTAEGALSLKPSIDRAGSLGGTTGLMGNQIPYFIITRPRMCKPANQDFFQGYPSFIQTTLGSMNGTGFTAFENVVLAGSYLTDTEKAELESILKSGVYL